MLSKAFTAWVNGVLDKIGERVNDITVDFSDGIKLVAFLELLSGKKLGKKLEENAKSRIHKIQNVFLAIQFTESLEVQAQGVGAEDFVDNNKKLILGFLWALYRKYRITVIKEGGMRLFLFTFIGICVYSCTCRQIIRRGFVTMVQEHHRRL